MQKAKKEDDFMQMGNFQYFKIIIWEVTVVYFAIRMTGKLILQMLTKRNINWLWERNYIYWKKTSYYSHCCLGN